MELPPEECRGTFSIAGWVPRETASERNICVQVRSGVPWGATPGRASGIEGSSVGCWEKYSCHTVAENPSRDARVGEQVEEGALKPQHSLHPPLPFPTSPAQGA